MAFNSEILDPDERPSCRVLSEYYSWGRRVKRKFAEVENDYLEMYSVLPDTHDTEDVSFLLEVLRIQYEMIEKLRCELDEERQAASSAAEETMSMILRLQKEKHDVQMELSQLSRFSESRFAHDQYQSKYLENLLEMKEETINSLQYEIQSIKERMLSLGYRETDIDVVMSPTYGSLLDHRSESPPLEELASQGEHLVQAGRMSPEEFSQLGDDVAGSLHSQHDLDESASQGLSPNSDADFNVSYIPISQDFDAPQNVGGYGYGRSDIDVVSLVANAIEQQLTTESLTVWQCIERLHGRTEQLDKRIKDSYRDVEMVATKEILRRKLVAYSDSLMGDYKRDSGDSPKKFAATSIDHLEQNDHVSLSRNSSSIGSSKSIASAKVPICRPSEKEDSYCHSYDELLSNDGSKYPESQIAEDDTKFAGAQVKVCMKQNIQVGPLEQNIQVAPLESYDMEAVEESEEGEFVITGHMQMKKNQLSAANNARVSLGDSKCKNKDAVKSSTENEEEASCSHHDAVSKIVLEDIALKSEVKELMSKVQLLEEERKTLRKEMQSLQCRNSNLVFQDSMSQQYISARLTDPTRNRRMHFLPERLSICAVLRWVISSVFKRNPQNCKSRSMLQVAIPSVGLLVLLDKTSKKRIGTFITKTSK